MDFEKWKLEATRHAEELGLCADDLWDEDACELAEAARAAYEAEVIPEAFIEEAFSARLPRGPLYGMEGVWWHPEDEDLRDLRE